MKHIFLLIILISCYGCYTPDKRVDIPKLYKEAIVFEKNDFRSIDGSVWFTLKYKGKYTNVEAYEIHFNYKVGDTIK